MAIANIASDVARNPLWQLVVLYIGPDLILPITSAFAAAAGVALMFWQRLLEVVRRLWHTMFQRQG
jgi:hypothetical protein